MAHCTIGKCTTDRPNPLGGVVVEGPVLNTSCCASRYGRLAVPHRHGMTIGELALLFDATLRMGGVGRRRLTVVPMLGWRRGMGWAATGLPWVPPSPNLPTPRTTAAYGATVFWEATTACEGRGTTTPFQLFGAPWLNSTLAAALALAWSARPECAAASGQSAFRAAAFTPTWFKCVAACCASSCLPTHPPSSAA